MRRSKVVAPIHLVWTTYQRMPLIRPEIEEALYRCICGEAERLKGEVLAIGGMPDHVHLVVMFPATVSFSKFVQQLKGVSSHFAKERLLSPEEFFYWQEGYGLFAFSARHIPRVVAYIQNQKQHHNENNLWPALEEADEEAPEH